MLFARNVKQFQRGTLNFRKGALLNKRACPQPDELKPVRNRQVETGWLYSMFLYQRKRHFNSICDDGHIQPLKKNSKKQEPPG